MFEFLKFMFCRHNWNWRRNESTRLADCDKCGGVYYPGSHNWVPPHIAHRGGHQKKGDPNAA